MKMKTKRKRFHDGVDDNAENNSNSNKKSSNKKRVKLRTQTAAYKVTRKIRSATERIRMIGSLCEKWREDCCQ